MIFAAIAAVVGILVGFLVSRVRSASVSANAEMLKRTNDELSKSLADTRQLLADEQNEKQRALTRCEVMAGQMSLLEQRMKENKDVWRDQMAEKERQHHAIVEAQEKRHNEAMAHMKESFQQTIDNLRNEMKSSTEEMLKARQQEFSDMSEKNIKGIVDPLNDTIEKMKLAMEGYSKEQSEFGGSLKANIDTIIKTTTEAQRSAVELTTALKHDTKVQGDYGEAILDEILCKQGFTKGIHYELQYVMKDEAGRVLKDDEGSGLRPDVLFHLDTVRDVIIDSKVNLTDFINFANAQTPEERQMYLDRHVKSVENQVKLLSQKNYAKFHKKTSGRMDYVIMFVPISAAWWEALRHKPSLWREAMENNVYIADEQTLFAALRIIKLTWTQIAQVNSQAEIFGLVNEMIDRVGQFMKHYTAIGAALKNAQEAYGKAENKLTEGGQSILTTTSKLLKKGGKDSKTNPVTPFLDVDDVEQLPE